MGDLWQDEGFGGASSSEFAGDDDWDEGEESLEASIEDGFDDPDEPDESDGDAWDERDEDA